MSDSPAFPVRFDDEAFAEDLAHASPAGRAVGERERGRLERDGIAPNELRACEPEARDGTRPAGCATTYLPAPDGQWGVGFRGERSPERTTTLLCLAFGRRHPRTPVAAQRLRGGASPHARSAGRSLTCAVVGAH